MEGSIQYERNKSQIHEMTQADIETWLTQLETRDLAMKDEPDVLSIAKSLYSVTDDIDIQKIHAKYRVFKTLLNELKARVYALDLQKVVVDDRLYIERIELLIRTWYYAYMVLYSAGHVFSMINTPECRIAYQNVDDSNFVYTSKDDTNDGTDKKTPWQTLLLYLLNELNVLRYKRYKGQCFREIKTATGKTTRAWEPVCDLTKFVSLRTDKDERYEMWKNLTSRSGGLRETVNFLETTVDRQFPEINKSRHVWAFKNGLLHSKYWNGTKYQTQFIDYESPEFDRLDPSVVASKYFDVPFEDVPHDTDWYTSISTPAFQSIMDYQKMPEEAKRWLYAFCGRMCFDVNEMDTWQVIPFLKGIAGSGKSKIISTCSRFYDNDDVRVLSNNVEKQFGLESIVNGFMFVSPEIKGDIKLEQADFQSLVSGEEMSVARKFKTSIYVRWKVPGMMAGNEQPGWRDNSGSILRRIVTWRFPVKVAEKDVDPKLELKLRQEMPMILFKCLRAYLDYSQAYCDKDVWSVMPEYFHTIRKESALISSVLESFLESDKVVYGSDLCIPYDIFVNQFTLHCANNNFGRPKVTPDLYNGPFSMRGLDVRTCTIPYKGSTIQNRKYVFGLEIRTDMVGLQINDDY